MVIAISATPFRKILIANRGEIVLRVIRSARELGYRTVAIYSIADAGARHVCEADQAVCVGKPLPAQSYLSIPAIIDAAKRSGADAVHPGYGFLAENEDFAQACKDAGLVFIGPSAETIRSMGHKAGAKALMLEAGVPCIPGYQGQDQSNQRMAQEAERIGFPVMIKASAGGGGRGMRLANSAVEFDELLRSARSEAQSAFGNSEMILERAIVEPRHIEIQIFADRYGNVIHLGERDCSVQRRHQKVVEETPSPAVDADLRACMGAIAVQAVKAIHYEGAGTLEFLLDREGNFYFMEMNTRLQVEHPVTEAITGLDLVALQLRVAAGEPLPLTQEDVRFKGHAIEVRLCAEDVDKGFMPQSGTVALWKMPSRLRVEHALQSGAEIPPFYDSMIAKFISHGETREVARRRLLSGLYDAVALGVTTNQTFLQRCLEHPVFVAGGATTAFIAQNQGALLAPYAATHARVAAVAAVLLYKTTSARRQRIADYRTINTFPITLRLDFDGQVRVADLSLSSRDRFEVTIDGTIVLIELKELGEYHARFICDDVLEHADFYRDGVMLLMYYRGESVRVEDRTRAAVTRQTENGGDGKVRATMNGRVVAVSVNLGDLVKVGQTMVTLEAMKMEHIHAAPVAGWLTKLHVKVGDQISAGHIVAEIKPAEVVLAD